MKKFFKKIDKALLAGITVFFSLLLSVLQYIISYDKLVPFWIIIVLLLVMYFIIIIIYAIFSNNASQERSKELIAIKKIDAIYILLKPSDKLQLNEICTVYYIKDQIEYKLGNAFVNNVQRDGKISIELLKVFILEEDYSKLKVKDIIIKTNLNIKDIKEIGGSIDE